ncbi:hypothetical protein [Algoriphagus halophilus]|uniref:HEAT repeat domain-containing protein n=1 Tax=Algoriphagus halophilus TaxID=226505 RepID=A0A1N6DY59_9BACT|nr:hypothetical protein [Algoriphagus halophilus]SIN75673.1 hypothetical protein SAMN05444394_1519 [Algoriphagus halophilus]
MGKLFTLGFSIVLLHTISLGVSFAQDSLPYRDSTTFFKFLEQQEEIPSLEYRYKLELKEGYEALLSDSTFQFSQLDNSTWVSKTYPNFSSWYAAGAEYLAVDSPLLQPEFLVYEEISDYQATQDYVSNLWRNQDIFIPESSPEVGDELVMLANLVPYEPMVKYRFHFFSDFKLVIVVSLIVFFLIMAIGMILFMLVIKTRHSKIEALKEKYEAQIIGPLSAVLFEKSEEEIELMRDADIYAIFPEKDFKKKLFKEVLIEKIISLNKKMKGDFKDKLKSLYKKFKLDVISFQNLKSKRWDVVTRGLVEINEMDLVEALPQVRELTNASNFYIRSQSIATLLNLSEKVDLSTIKKQSYPLSRWQQMNYLRIIKYLHIQKSLKIDTLFYGENQTIRLFGYKLVRMLGRVELVGQLAELAPKVDDVEKIEILKTYQIIGIHTEATFVNQCLRSDNPDLVVAAAKASGVIGDQVSAHILIELLNEQPNFQLKMLFLENLLKLDQSMYQEYISKSNDLELSQIHAHLVDPLLQHV